MGMFFGWIIFSCVVGALGSRRNIGFWSSFLLSIFLSPLVGLIVVLFSKDKEDEIYKQRVLQIQQNSLNRLSEKITTNQDQLRMNL